MASYRSAFGDLLEPGFREIFNDAYEELPQVFPQLFHVNTSTKQDEKDSGVTGFGMLQQTNEGASVDYEDPIFKRVAYDSNIIRKFLNLRERLFEIIRSQIKELVSFLRGSETIIGTSFGMVG